MAYLGHLCSWYLPSIHNSFLIKTWSWMKFFFLVYQFTLSGVNLVCQTLLEMTSGLNRTILLIIPILECFYSRQICNKSWKGRVKEYFWKYRLWRCLTLNTGVKEAAPLETPWFPRRNVNYKLFLGGSSVAIFWIFSSDCLVRQLQSLPVPYLEAISEPELLG